MCNIWPLLNKLLNFSSSPYLCVAHMTESYWTPKTGLTDSKAKLFNPPKIGTLILRTHLFWKHAMLPEKKSQVGKSKIDCSHSKTTFFDEPPWEFVPSSAIDIPLTAPVLRWNQQADGFSRKGTLPKFNSSPLKSYQNPIGKDRLPIIIFRGHVKLWGGIMN